jgi:uncharacterized protein (DUF342 family)
MSENEKLLNAEEFSADQLREIEEGIDSGLDVAIYAKKEYMAIQMRQIRLGLMQGLPVEKYANTDYDWFQMEEIRKGLEAGVDTSLYASPRIPYDKMRQIRIGLEQGVDLTAYLQLNAGVLAELREALEDGVDIEKYIDEGYEKEQLQEIRKALLKKLDIDPYLSKEYRGASISEIANGLEQGVNVSAYAKPVFGWQQMREIRLGMVNRLNVGLYARPLYSWQQMREIRLGMENGLDVTQYKSLMYTARDMQKARLRMMEKAAQEAAAAGSAESETHRTAAFFITFSADEMEAYMELPPGAASISRKEVMNALKQSGIIYGVREKGIEDLLADASAAVHRRVLVASGVAPQAGRDGYYEFFFRTDIEREPKLLADGSVDYQSIEWFETVEEGQKLVYYHSAEEGTDGCTVTGRVQKARKGKEKPMLSGRGFRLLPDGKTYLADVNGKVEFRNNRLEVVRLLVLSEVSMATGSINFDGCVYIRGNVGSGAVVKATEDVIVDGFVESAVIETGGNLLLRQGVNASGRGMIKARKEINGKFFEAVSVCSNKDIRANYCLNCEVYTEGQLIISGKKGILAGGNVSAVRGIAAYHVGNRAGIPTFLKVGVNDAIIKKQTDAENQIKEINRELNILGNAYRDFQRKYPPEIRNTMDMYLKIERAIYTKEKELERFYKTKAELDADIENKSYAEVLVRGNLYEGVVIEIDRKRWSSAKLSNVTIKKIENRIAAFAN